MTLSIIEATEDYNAMKTIRDMAFTRYCNDQSNSNFLAHQSAINAVTDASHQLSELVSKELAKNELENTKPTNRRGTPI